MNGRFKRVVDFYGEEGFQRIRNSAVLVAGLGGVGSHCALALARSGVGRLYLADFDVITESSLNRNPLACLRDIGSSKALFLCSSLSEQCPDTHFKPLEVFLCMEYLEKNGLPEGIAAVADAIDSLNPKTQLLEYCHTAGISVFSSMGAAGRRDPGQIRTGDISESRGCPLARMVRKYLKRRGISKGIRCIWSTEKAVDPLPPDNEALMSRGRIRNALPSLITMPGIFGYSIAQMILNSLAGEV